MVKRRYRTKKRNKQKKQRSHTHRNHRNHRTHRTHRTHRNYRTKKRRRTKSKRMKGGMLAWMQEQLDALRGRTEPEPAPAPEVVPVGRDSVVPIDYDLSSGSRRRAVAAPAAVDMEADMKRILRETGIVDHEIDMIIEIFTSSTPKRKEEIYSEIKTGNAASIARDSVQEESSQQTLAPGSGLRNRRAHQLDLGAGAVVRREREQGEAGGVTLTDEEVSMFLDDGTDDVKVAMIQ